MSPIIEEISEEKINKYNNCTRTSIDFISKYQLPESYIPYSDTAPLITVKINFNVWQKADGTGNWPQDPQVDQFFQQTVYNINNHHIGFNYLPSKPVPGAYPHVSDTRIRVEHEVFYYTVDSLHGINNGNALLDYIEIHHPERLEGININIVRVFTTHTGSANGPDYNTDTRNLYVLHSNKEVIPEYIPTESWAFADHIAHELGHNFDLHHTYLGSPWPELVNPTHPDFLSDVLELVGDNYWPCYDPLNGICYHNHGWDGCSPTDSLSGCSNNLMGGVHIGKNKTPLQIGRMRRELSLKTTRKYGYGYHEIPYSISQNETWDFSIKFYQDVVVESGATLTVQCEVQMVPEAKIVIKPGGKLIVDGGRIGTDYFNKAPWKGIYVEGNRNLSQTFANQGAVILQNGAIIENAVSAINLHSYDEMWWTNGGIVQATNATFRNNRRDVAFVAYQNKNSSGTEINNISYLTGCTFTIDDNSLFENPIQNVTLWSVKGIVFTNCNFSDTRTGLVYEGSETNARDGIYAYTATFKALGCDFTNLKYGIYNTSVGASHTFTAGNCEFDCFRGLYNNSAVNPSIYSNQFTVRPGYMFNDDMGSCSDTYGLYMDNSLNFNIHDNIFTSSGTQAPYCNSFGVIVRNSGSTYKNLYRNTFSGFYNGIQAIGNNKGLGSGDGLEIRCNFFSNDHYMDIYVTSPGIRFYQGLKTVPSNDELAGNLFSDNTWYWNSGDLFHYYHHDPASHPNILPDYYNPNKIAMFQATGLEFYFDTIASCPLPTRSRSLEMLVTDITDAKTQYDETDQLLQSYVDDGNTDLMTQQVEMTGDYDAWQTYQYLMQTSPYLSEEVLSTLSEREDGFNQAMIRDVLVENPQAAKSQEVTEALDNRINQLPAYMRWQIRNGLYQFGQKEIMELHQAAQKIRFDEAVNEMIFHKMEGTEGWENTPSLSELLADVDDASFQFLRSEFAFDENGYDAAITTLNQIATDFTLADAADQQKWNDYMQYYSVMNALEQANDTLTEAQLQQLMALTEASPRVAGKAIAYLMHHNMLDYQEPIYYPEEEMEMKSGTVEMQPEIMVLEESTTDKFLIFPNPALDYITLSWCSDVAISAGMSVDFFDSRGVLVHKEPLTSNCDQVILQVTNWKSGTYTATFTGSTTHSITFVVGR